MPDPDQGGFQLSWLGTSPPAATALPPAMWSVALPPFQIIGAVQDFGLSPHDVHGNGIAYLFNRPPRADIGAAPDVFEVRSTFSGFDVHGSAVHRETTKKGAAAFLQDDGRVVLVRYSGPISPLVAGDGTPLASHQHIPEPAAILDRFGNALTGPVPAVATETTPLHVGGLVAGRAIRGSGEAAAGARVELLRVRWPRDGTVAIVDVVESVTTNDSGEFYFDFVEQPHCDPHVEDQYILRATVPAGDDPVTEPATVGEVTSVIRQQNLLTYVNIALLGRGTVSGRLVYADTGAPVASGEVTAASTLFREMKTAKTATDGSFTLPGVPVGPIILTGRDSDRNSVYATIGVDHPGAIASIVLQLQRASAPSGVGTVLGTVVRRFGAGDVEETAVTGATVALYSAGNPIALQETDASGRFRFSDVPEGQVTVQAADWRISRTPVLTDLMLSAGETRAVKLTLRASALRAATGAVYFHDPLSGQLVPVAEAPVFIAGPGIQARTGSDGTYRLEGIPVQGVTDADYVVTAIDYARQLQGQVRLEPVLEISPETVEVPPIVLEPVFGGVDGVVLDPLGRPFDGAEVVLFPIGINASHNGGKFSFNNVPIGAIDVTGGTRLIAHVGDGLQEGSVGYFGGAATQVVYGGHRPFVTVRMRGSGIVRIHTKTATASGIKSLVYARPMAYVEAAKSIRPLPEYIQSDTTEAGELELELPVGPFDLIAYNPFHGTRAIQGEITYPGQILPYDIVFANAGEVTGTVLDVDGMTPVPGASVTLRTDAFEPRVLTADGLGRFAFALVPPGNAMLTAAGVAGGVERVGAALGAITMPGQVLEVPIRLKARGSVSGRVMEQKATGLVPVPFAQVYAHEYSYPNRRVPDVGRFVLANADGRYQIQSLNAGGIGVIARDSAQVERTGSVSGAITADWQVASLPDIVLTTAVGSLSVTVRRGGTGELVPDCQVTLSTGEATVSDATGVAVFDALPLGSYSVYAFHAPSGRGKRKGGLTITIPGESVVTVVDLEQSGEVRGTLFDDPGHALPVPGATVELRGTTSVGELRALATTEGATSSPGRFGFGGIPEGLFTLTAASAGSPRRAATDVEAHGVIADSGCRARSRGRGRRPCSRTRETARRRARGRTTKTTLSVRLDQSGYSFTQIEPVVTQAGHVFPFPSALTARPGYVTVQRGLGGERRSGRIELPAYQGPGSHGGHGTSEEPMPDRAGSEGSGARDRSRRPGRARARRHGGTLLGGRHDGERTDRHLRRGAGCRDVPGGAGRVADGKRIVTAHCSRRSRARKARGGRPDRGPERHLRRHGCRAGTVRQPAPGDIYAGDGSSLPPQDGAAVEITDSAASIQTAVTGTDGGYRFVGVRGNVHSEGVAAGRRRTRRTPRGGAGPRW